MATASASAAWSGVGGAVEGQQRLDHPADLVLGGAAAAADRGLDLLRRVARARDAGLAGGEHHDAAGLPDGEGAARVGAEVEVLEGDRVGPVLGDQRLDAGVDLGQPRLGRDAGPGLDHAAVERRAGAHGLSDTTP